MKTSKSNINEKKLSKAELNRREEIIKDLKGNKREFVKRYGKDAEKVMYARATNIAKKQAEAMNPESANKIKEAIKTALMGPVKEKKEFPDLTGDGKVTKADILKGRGVELKEEFQEPNEEAYAITFLEYLKKDGKDSKYADRVATLMRAYTGKVFESTNEGIFDRFKKKSSSEERPIGTGTTMDGGFGFASDESYELLKKIAKEKGAELTGMGENERYISFGLATTEDDTYTERDYYYDKETGKIIEKGTSKQLPENVNEGDLDLGHQDNEPHMLKADLYRIGKYAMELYQMVDGFEGQGEVDFPHWWQSKIIKSKDAIVGAKHYLDFEIKEPQIDAMVDVAAEEDVIDESQLGIFTTTIDPKVHNGNDAWGMFLRDYARNKGVSDEELGKMSLSDMNLKYGDKAKKEFNLTGRKFIDFVRQLVKQGQIELVKEDVIDEAKYDGSIQMPSQEEVDAFFKSTGNESHYLANKPVMGQEATSNLMPIEPWDAYDYSNWLALTRKRQPTFEGIAEKLAKQLKSR